MSETQADYGSGHGWVTPRRDGAKARCGGPAICKGCQEERRMMDAVARQRAAGCTEGAGMTPERLAEIRQRLSTGENADPSCLDCNEHVLLSEVDRLTARLADLEPTYAALAAEVDAYDQAGYVAARAPAERTHTYVHLTPSSGVYELGLIRHPVRFSILGTPEELRRYLDDLRGELDLVVEVAEQERG